MVNSTLIVSIAKSKAGCLLANFQVLSWPFFAVNDVYVAFVNCAATL
ncbi:hypothetical protein GCM10008920_10760 [Pediococcus acidilactici]|nr:hypothetical protein GCM10008920_10760 [Pediococcus acidilactici]